MKVISSGSSTFEWCRKTFETAYDFIYISASPGINSKCEVRRFDARRHFHKVVDVWDWGWSNEKGVVPPKEVTLAALKSKEEYPRKRMIIHYNQPHAPYLSFSSKNSRNQGFTRPSPFKKMINLFMPLKRRFLKKLIWKIGQRKTWKLRNKIGFMEPFGDIYEIVTKHGEEKLSKLYEQNLRLVLSEVADLIENLMGKIIITADHGEALGEDGNYGHASFVNRSELIEVPWLVINKS